MSLQDTPERVVTMEELIASFREFLFNRLYNDYRMATLTKGLKKTITHADIRDWVYIGRVLLEGCDEDLIDDVQAAARLMHLEPNYLQNQLKTLALKDGNRWNGVKALTEKGHFRDLAAKILRDLRHLDHIVPRTSWLRKYRNMRMRFAIAELEARYFERLARPDVYLLTDRARRLNKDPEPMVSENPFLSEEERREFKERFRKMIREGFFKS